MTPHFMGIQVKQRMRGHQRKAGKETLIQSTCGRVNRLQTTKGDPLFLAFLGTVPLLYYTLVFALLSAAWGAGNSPVCVSCGPKIRFNMTGRCLRPWSVKAGQTSGLHSPDALRDLEGWQGLKSTEGPSFKCNGFQWLNVSLFSLREMSPRCNVALSPANLLFKSFTVWRTEVQIQLSWERNYANDLNTSLTMEEINPKEQSLRKQRHDYFQD